MTDYTKATVTNVLKVLAEDRPGVLIDKILIHKFLYFMDSLGLRPGLTFEPYTYGPFSFDLASLLSRMMFWDEVVDAGHGVQIKNLSAAKMPNDAQSLAIKDLLVKFKSVVGELTFDNLECAGTVLYCARALGGKANEETVLDEFKAWKGGRRYTDEKIRGFWNRIKPLLHSQASDTCEA